MVARHNSLSMPLWLSLGAIALVVLPLGIVLALREAAAHGYSLWPPSQGAWAALGLQMRRLLIGGAGIYLLLLLPWLWRGGRAQDRVRVANGWAACIALSLWAWQGYQFNRYRALAAWRESSEWLGLPLPVALTQPAILGRNLLLTFAAILLALLLSILLRRFLPAQWPRSPRGLRLASVAAGLLALLLAVRPLELGRPRPLGPDIVLISLDATRADHLGAYGGRGITPQLDSLALRSEIFEHAYCQEPWTLTSHMSMLTGLYPDAHGLDFGRALPAPVWTLAERLRDGGYRTAASVRDCFLLSPRFGYAAGFDRYEEDDRDAAERCAAAADWLLADERPGFLFLHLYDPHSDSSSLPYEVPPAFLPDGVPREAFANWTAGRGASEALRRVNAAQLDLPESLAVWVPRLYAASLRATDAALGALFDRLKRAGRLDSTLIVVVADHGEALGERAHWMHEELMQATLQVPLLVHWPSQARRGKRSDLAESLDLMPTLLEAAGLARESISQGLSLSRPTERRFVSHRSGPRYAITTADGWRLEYEMGEAGFLPLALRRVDGSGGDGPDLLADSLAVVDRWIEPIAQLHRANAALSGRWRGASVALDRADEELLRSLGYID